MPAGDRAFPDRDLESPARHKPRRIQGRQRRYVRGDQQRNFRADERDAVAPLLCLQALDDLDVAVSRDLCEFAFDQLVEDDPVDVGALFASWKTWLDTDRG